MAQIKWIPVDLIQSVLQRRLINEFKIYLLINLHSNGYNVNDSGLINKLSILTNWTPKTVRKHMETLIQIGWLGHSEDVIYVRSIWWIKDALYKSMHNRAVEFDGMWLECWRGYLIASFIGHLAYVQQLKSIAETLSSSGQEKGCPYQRVRVSASFPVSHKSIEKILGVTTSTAHKWKMLAVECGLVSKQSDFSVISTRAQYEIVKPYLKDIPGLHAKGNEVIKQLPDRITPLLRYRSGKKRKHTRRDTKGNN